MSEKYVKISEELRDSIIDALGEFNTVDRRTDESIECEEIKALRVAPVVIPLDLEKLERFMPSVDYPGNMESCMGWGDYVLLSDLNKLTTPEQSSEIEALKSELETKKVTCSQLSAEVTRLTDRLMEQSGGVVRVQDIRTLRKILQEKDIENYYRKGGGSLVDYLESIEALDRIEKDGSHNG